MIKNTHLWHYSALFFIIIILTVLTVAVISINALNTGYYTKAEIDLKETTEVIRHIFFRNDYFSSEEEINRFCQEIYREEGTRVSIIKPGGEVIGDSHKAIESLNNHLDREEVLKAIETGYGVSLRYSTSLGFTMMYLALPAYNETGKIKYIIRTSQSLEVIQIAIQNGVISITIASILILITSLLLIGAAYRGISRPLVHLRDAALRYAEADFGTDLKKINAPSEISLLTDTLNHMSRQLQNRIFTVTRQKNEFAGILKNMMESVIVLDSNLYIKNMNPAACRLAGKTEMEAKEKSLLEIFRSIHLNRFAEKTLKSNTSEMDEINYVNDITQTEYSLQVHGTFIETVDGQMAKRRLMLVLNDITTIKQLEKIRKDFVANVSHELKTPITSIKGFVETLLEGAADNPEISREFLNIIAKHTDRVQAIIEDLLSLSKLDSDETIQPEYEHLEIEEIIQNAVHLAEKKAEAKDIDLLISQNDKITAAVNPLLLEQAVFNLIENGIKYSPVNSKIEIKLLKKKNIFQITIKDNGKGIPERDLPRIFERFYRVDKARSRNEGGTGLGLAIAKHIIQGHKGDIEVKSRINHGSEFIISLPYSQS